MPINTDVTLRRLVHELAEWSSSHKMISRFFGYGEYLQLSSEVQRSYPAMIANVTSANSDKWYINYNFEVMILQFVNDEQDNRERAMSDCRQILNDLQETISYSNRWQSFSRLDGVFTATPAIQKGADKAFGWIGVFTLKVKKRHGICDIQSLMPEYDFQTGTITTPACKPVSIYKDGVFEIDVDSGGRFDYNTDCEPATITVNGDAFGTVDSGGDLDIVVRYETAGEIGTITAGEIVIPDPTPDVRIYNPPMYSGAINNGEAYDVYWRKINNIGNFTQPMKGVAMRLAFGRYDLIHPDITIGNVFGNWARWTGTTGGYKDLLTGVFYDINNNVTTESLAFPDGLVVDHWLGYLVQLEFTSTLKTPTTWFVEGQTLTIGAFTGFYGMSVPEIIQFGDWGQVLGYTNHPLFKWGTGVKLTAETYAGGTNQVMVAQSYNHITSTNRLNTNKLIYIKPIDINAEFG